MRKRVSKLSMYMLVIFESRKYPVGFKDGNESGIYDSVRSVLRLSPNTIHIIHSNHHRICILSRSNVREKYIHI